MSTRYEALMSDADWKTYFDSDPEITNLRKEIVGAQDEEVLKRKCHDQYKADLQEAWEKLVSLRSHVLTFQNSIDEAALEEAKSYAVSPLELIWEPAYSAKQLSRVQDSSHRMADLQELKQKLPQRELLKMKLTACEDMLKSLRSQMENKSAELMISSRSTREAGTSSITMTMELRQSLLQLSRDLAEAERDYLRLAGELEVVDNALHGLLKGLTDVQKANVLDEMSLLASHNGFIGEGNLSTLGHLQLTHQPVLTGIAGSSGGVENSQTVSVTKCENDSTSIKCDFSLHEILSGQGGKVRRINGEHAYSYRMRLEKRQASLKILEQQLEVEVEGLAERVREARDILRDAELRRLRLSLRLANVENLAKQRKVEELQWRSSASVPSPVLASQYLGLPTATNASTAFGTMRASQSQTASQTLSPNRQIQPMHSPVPSGALLMARLGMQAKYDHSMLRFGQSFLSPDPVPGTVNASAEAVTNAAEMLRADLAEQFESEAPVPQMTQDQESVAESAVAAQPPDQPSQIPPSTESMIQQEAVSDTALVMSPPLNSQAVRERLVRLSQQLESQRAILEGQESLLQVLADQQSELEEIRRLALYPDSPTKLSPSQQSILSSERHSQNHRTKRVTDRPESSRGSHQRARSTSPVITRADIMRWDSELRNYDHPVADSESDTGMDLAASVPMRPPVSATGHRKASPKRSLSADPHSRRSSRQRRVSGARRGNGEKLALDDNYLPRSKTAEDSRDRAKAQAKVMERLSRRDRMVDRDRVRDRVRPEPPQRSHVPRSHSREAYQAAYFATSGAPLLPSEIKKVNQSDTDLEEEYILQSIALLSKRLMLEDRARANFTASQQCLSVTAQPPVATQSTLRSRSFLDIDVSGDRMAAFNGALMSEAEATISGPNSRLSPPVHRPLFESDSSAKSNIRRANPVTSAAPGAATLQPNQTTATAEVMHVTPRTTHSKQLQATVMPIVASSLMSDDSVTASQLALSKPIPPFRPVLSRTTAPTVSAVVPIQEVALTSSKPEWERARDWTWQRDGPALLAQLEDKLAKAEEKRTEAERDERIDPATGIALDPRTGVGWASLEVLVVGAKNVPEMKRTTKSADVYTELWLANAGDRPARPEDRQRTSTKWSTLFPQWREKFTLGPVTSLHGALCLELKDATKFGVDRSVGDCVLPLSQLLDQHPHLFIVGVREPSLAVSKARSRPRMVDCTVKVEARLTYCRSTYWTGKATELRCKIDVVKRMFATAGVCLSSQPRTHRQELVEAVAAEDADKPETEPEKGVSDPGSGVAASQRAAQQRSLIPRYRAPLPEYLASESQRLGSPDTNGGCGVSELTCSDSDTASGRRDTASGRRDTRPAAAPDLGIFKGAGTRKTAKPAREIAKELRESSLSSSEKWSN